MEPRALRRQGSLYILVCMNQRVFKTLEFDKIREQLAAFAGCDETRKKLLSLAPMTDVAEVEAALTETDDALKRILKYGALSFSGIRDIRPSLRRLEIGSTLDTRELLDIASLLETAEGAAAFSKDTPDEEIQDSLTGRFHALVPVPALRKEIRRCIPAPDELSDDASPRLASIRRKIAGMDGRIHDKLTSLLNSTEMRSHLRDSVITTREGRYCLPVKAESKNAVDGLVHDHSGSGSTFFIEPMAVVQLNNELREYYQQEQEEIAVILANLSVRVSEYAEQLNTDYILLLELDFIFSKAVLAQAMNGTKPLLNTKGRINLRKARHPLLDQHTVVPIDLTLGESFDQLILTGPNTGGKTVSLKTTGLLTIMGLSGLLIPAAHRSELSVFQEVYADIGDEQSIEQSLSTFSSHMKNIVYILKHANRSALVLFDELCAGTDPTEGAALAISILEELHRRSVRTMATTHYSELKVYAMTHPLISNGSLEFDVETLSPTYRLLIGIPGKSNAFAISKKLGLKDDLIENAKAKLSENTKDFEDLIADLEKSRIALEEEQKKVAGLRAEAEALQKKNDEKQASLLNSREKILSEAHEEALKILREAKETADSSIRNFQKYGTTDADVSARALEEEREKLRKHMKKSEAALSEKKQKETAAHVPPKKVAIGDRVRVLSMNLTGTVHTLPNEKQELVVQMGILHSTVKLNDLELLPDEDAPKKKFTAKGAGSLKMNKAANISSEINLIGKTTDEALAALEKYLDDAYLAGIPKVRIVHGKGTGALRNAVQQRLKKLSYIASYRLGEYGEGDAGVTIAEFK